MSAPRLLLGVTGLALRGLLPLLHRLADALDPAGTATSAWGPRDLTTLTVPAAWCEIEAEGHP